MAFGSTSTSTTGRQQTALSKQAAPPGKKHWILWSTAAPFCGFYAPGQLAHPGSGHPRGAGPHDSWQCEFAISGRQFNAEVHPGLMQKWEQSFMCNRCGAHFVAA